MRGIGLGRGAMACALAMLALGAIAGAALGAPLNTAPPEVSGEARIGQTLSASDGEWSAPGATSYSYRWEYVSGAEPCEQGESDCEGAIRYLWSPIEDADESALVVSEDLVMLQLRVVVTAESDGEQASAASARVGPVLGYPAVNITAPSLSGQALQGQSLQANTGLWEGEDLQFGYSWERSNADGSDWLPIFDAFGDLYAVRAEDAGRRIRVRVLATNSGGTVSALSAPTDVVPAGAPVNTGAPTIDAPPASLHPVEVSVGAWSGSGPIGFSYAWQRDQPAGSGGGWETIAGADALVFAPSTAEVGHRLRLIVNASNAAGTASATSAASEPVVEGPPANLEPPEISGGLAEGQLLSAAVGSWLGASGFGYQWQRDQPADSGSGWLSIPDADQVQYRLGAKDVGHQLRVLVRATNGAGETEIASEAVLAEPALLNLEAAPTIGVPASGQPLVAEPGTWSGSAPIGYAFQWQSDQTGDWADIVDADDATFTPDDDLIGTHLRFIVTASNPAGAASHISTPSAAVTPAPPGILFPPAIAGVAVEGQPFVTIDGASLVATAGGWAESGVVVYSWRWEREDQLGGWSVIAGAESDRYQLQSDDVGRRVRAVQIADNEAPGIVASPSAPSEVVVALPVSALGAPELSGAAVDQGQLSVSPGQWAGSTPLVFGYRWQMDDPAGGSDWVDLDGENQDAIALGPQLIGHRLRAVVTANNAAGIAAQQFSAPSDVIAAAPPVSTTAPQISGTTRDGQLLSVAGGGWNGSAPIALSYRWEREVEGNWQVIAGESAVAYEIRTEDIGRRLRAVEVAANAAGSAEAASAPSDPVAAAPLSLESAPVLSGTARDGEVLSVSSGSFAGSLPVGFEYRWQRDQPAGSGSGWEDVAGAQQSSLQLGAADVGHRLRAVVRAENAAGALEAPSDDLLIAAAPPLNTLAVSIDADAGVGLELVADPGEWSGTAPLSFGYQWQVDDGTGWTAIVGADEARFTPDDQYVGLSLRVRVTASNAAGEAEATSASTGALASRPVAGAQPVLSGTPVEGQTLGASTGDWDGYPFPSIQIVWQRDADGSGTGWTSIDGAVGGSYQLSGEDIGRRVRAVALASNGFPGGASAASEASAVIGARAPVSSQVPDLTGDPIEGQLITGTTGGWSGTAPISYSYQWQREIVAGQWSDITGADQAGHLVVLADVGASLRLRVVASNSAGQATAYSEALAVPMPAQVIPSAPRLSLVGDRLSVAVTGDGYQEGVASLEARINAVWQTVFQTPALAGETILSVQSAQVGAGPVRVRLVDRYGRQWLSEELEAPVEVPPAPFVPPRPADPPSGPRLPGTESPGDGVAGGRLQLDRAATLRGVGASAIPRAPGVRLTIAYGGLARITVRLVSFAGTPRAGEPVSLFQGMRFLASGATGADGRVRLSARLTQTGEISAVWNASARERDRLTVPTTLSYRVTSGVKRSGTSMRVSGRLTPSPSLLGARYLPRVRLERLNTAARGCAIPARAPARCWAGIGPTRHVSARGVFALSARRAPSGRYRLRVRVLVPAGSSLGAATGAPLRAR